MKKKSPRDIPDFSSKGPKSLSMQKFLKDKQQQHQPKPVANPAQNIKPPSTSQKSGRRGS